MRPGRTAAAVATVSTADLLLPAEAARRLRVSEKTLANMRTRREGPPYVRVSGSLVRYSAKALDAWLAERAVGGGATT